MKKKPSAVIGTYKGKCADSAVFNNNQMKLPKELFEILLASDEFKNAMKNRYYIGFLGHPEDPGCMDFEHACIVMTDMWLEGDDVYGTFDLVDTPVGRVVKAFQDAGVVFGISIRGAGDVDGNGEVDPETFVFRGYDLVTFPAYNDAVPTFQEIAASSDLDAQVKYKKVCATVSSNLSAITSASTIETIQAQFKPGTKEYEALEARKAELEKADEVDEKLTDIGTEVDLVNEKLEGMTQLYLEQVEANKKLHQELIAARVQTQNTKIECSRKLKVVKRISSSQVADLSRELDKVSASYKVSVAANSKLKEELQLANETNLKYTHKITANSDIISQKDSIISTLKAELSETVTANTADKRRASNLDETNRNLQKKIEAAEQMIYEYQQAYANMYANALGVHLKDLPVTASTSVQELQSMVSGGTSTSNMSANLSNELSSIEPIDMMTDEDVITL